MRARLLILGLLALPLLVPAPASASASFGRDSYCEPFGFGSKSCAERRLGRRYCGAIPKRHGRVRARCVRSIAFLAGHRRVRPSRACRGLPRRKLSGMRRVTPYRVCVNGGRRIQRRRR